MTSIFSKIYRTWICSWCRRRLKDKERIYCDSNLPGCHFCEDCKDLLENTPDFNEKGSMEEGTTSWVTARSLILLRDDCHCRVCDSSYEHDNPVDVHHIIPKKKGGTNHPKNLITLCQRHHRETYMNNHSGLQITDRLVQLGIQKTIMVKVAEK